MARGFAGGIIWGGVIVVAGLVALSQLSPPPERGPVANQDAAPGGAAPKPEGQGSAVATEPEGQSPAAPATPEAQTDPAASPAAQPAEAAMPETVAPGAATPEVAATASTSTASASMDDVETQAPGSAETASKESAAPKPESSDAEAQKAAPVSEAKTDSSDPAALALSSEAKGAPSPTPSHDAPAAAPEGNLAPDPTASPDSLPPDSAPPESQAPSATASASLSQDAAAPTSQSAEPPADPSALADQSAEPAPLPPLPDTPAADQAPPSLAALDSALRAPEPEAPPASAPLGVTQAPADLAPPSPGEAPAQLTEPARLPQISSESDPALAPQPLPNLQPPTLEPPAQDAALPPADPPKPSILKPGASGLPGKPATSLPQSPALSATPAQPLPEGDGRVVVNDLPQIGTPDAAASAAPAEDMRPLVAFSRPFDAAAEAGKPLFSILLRDIGDRGLPREQLAQLPFPVSIVIDPLAPDAKAAAAAWRAAGQEVVLLASGLPKGAKAEDVAQSFQAMAAILPEAVAVLDPREAGFQDDRALSRLVLTEVAGEGRGILTWDQGLNAADQIARRDGLPAAVIYRLLDGQGESQPVIRRYLDRAAFKAGQEGQVVVIGDTSSDTVEAILGWALEGKGAAVALAPVSAVLLGKK